MNLNGSIKTGSLIGKYLAGKESEKEAAQLRDWLNEGDENRKLFDSLKEKRNIGGALEEYEAHNTEMAWQRYLDRIGELKLRKLLIRWKVAAIFFFVIGCAGILTMLIQGNGLLQGREELYTTVSTQNGQNSKIVLPDSSVVWVNSGTTLSYNSNFAISKRDIRLVGEAYFEVSRNENMPLTVSCNELRIKVLGTRFDVSAYSDDDRINVVLESGKVELLRDSDKSFGYTMTPGEKVEFNTQQKEMSVSTIDLTKFTSWRNGVLIFKNDPMDMVFKKLERWYNIQIEVKDPKVNQLIFNATIVNESIDEIFELIRFTCGVNYKIIPSKNPEVPVKVVISAKTNS
jgi:transmembrane sensor